MERDEKGSNRFHSFRTRENMPSAESVLRTGIGEVPFGAAELKFQVGPDGLPRYRHYEYFSGWYREAMAFAPFLGRRFFYTERKAET